MSVKSGAARLMNRDYLLLWQGQLVSQVGSQAFVVAMMYWTMEITGSASLMGLLMTLSIIPGVLLSPFGGTLADRYSRRSIIIISDLTSGVAVLGLASFFLLWPTAHSALLTGLFSVALVLGIVQAFFRPAISASIPDLVPVSRLQAANSLTQFSNQFSTILGQGVGGVAYALLGPWALFLVDGVSFLFSAGSETFIKIPQQTPDRVRGMRASMAVFRHDLVDGMRFVWRRRGMRELMAMVALINFFFMPVIVLMPFFVERSLHKGAAWYGFVFAAYSAGSVVGYLLAGTLRISGRARARLVLMMLVAGGLCFVALAMARRPWLALVLMAASGVMIGMFNIVFVTVFQVSTPSAIRGRVLGLASTMSMAVAPIGMALGGVVGDLTGKNVPLIYAVCGGLVALTALVLGTREGLRDYLSWETPTAEAVEAAEPAS